MGNNHKIQSIYETYFEIIEDYYGRYFKLDDPISSVENLLKKPMTSRILYQTSDTIVEEVNLLFKKNSELLRKDISSLDGINANFCGDFSPLNAKNYVAKTGLYVDTNIISDPLTSSLLLKSRTSPFEFNRLFFKHAFNMLDLKKALINDSEKPILRIIPRSIFWKEGKPSFIDVDIKTIEYFNELFDENFKDEESLNKFLADNTEIESFTSKIKKREILKPALLNSPDLKIGLNGLLSQANELDSHNNNISEAFYTNVKGSMVRNISDLKFSQSFNLLNSFDGINSWHFYKWFLQKQVNQINSDSFILNSITLDKVKWIGNLKIDDVITAREKSCLQDFREILRKEITESNCDNINEVASQVNYNLRQAFKKHETELKKIEQDFNFNYPASSSAILGGTISLMGGIASQNVLGIVGGGVAIAGGLTSWIKTNLDYNKKKDIINSPIGLLFEEEKNDR